MAAKQWLLGIGTLVGSYLIVRQVTAGGAGPTSDFTYSIDGNTVSFQSNASDPEGAIVEYQWDFGDGTTASGVSATHTYAEPGTYSVTHTVIDHEGHVATGRQDVTIIPSDRLLIDGPGLSLAAEQATLSGNAILESLNDGFTGDGYINFDTAQGTQPGGSATWPLFVTAPGEYDLAFRYSLADPATPSPPRTADLVVGGQAIPVTAPTTGDFNTWATNGVTVTLPEGAVDVTLQTTGEDWANIDFVDVVPAGSTTPFSAPVAGSLQRRRY